MLKGKIAIITGGAKGIGQAVALKLTEYGAKVVLTDTDEENLQKTAKLIKDAGSEVMTYRMDVSKKAECEASVNAAVENFGTLDILVNSAGIIRAGLLVDMPEDDWKKVIDVNLNGTFFMGQAAMKVMIPKKYGRIINIASQAGKLGEAGAGPYCASKAGIVRLTEVQGLELAEHGVTANGLSPGYIDTQMMRDVFDDRAPVMGMSVAEYEAMLMKTVPMGRMAKPEEVAELIAFLASDKAAYITGVTYTIAGGKLLF